ncbi:MAG: helix-turn-helix domain-containing protein [Crocinitomicaceae bacterium]|nr:helix-turn-helix domain-containing protein [Flavobacteriales bacterium]NQZ36435.1 helix-turn-helix domain-containing protein [Crocinitomicaceae bacterium]
MNWNKLSHEETIKQFGIRLKQIRKELKLSQVTVADKAGVSVVTISTLENGSGFSIDTLIRILRVYGMIDRLEDLFQLPRKSLFQQFKDSK